MEVKWRWLVRGRCAVVVQGVTCALGISSCSIDLSVAIASCPKVHWCERKTTCVIRGAHVHTFPASRSA